MGKLKRNLCSSVKFCQIYKSRKCKSSMLIFFFSSFQDLKSFFQALQLLNFPSLRLDTPCAYFRFNFIFFSARKFLLEIIAILHTLLTMRKITASYIVKVSQGHCSSQQNVISQPRAVVNITLTLSTTWQCRSQGSWLTVWVLCQCLLETHANRKTNNNTG